MSTATDVDRDSAVQVTSLAALTVDPVKVRTYRHDPYAREGLLAADRIGVTADTLRDHTFVVLKPDAVVGRRGPDVLDVLYEQGWHPRAATTIRFDPLLTRELWRYQFNAASVARIAVVDHLLGSGDSLLVLLADTERPDWLPASVRLTQAKGSAEPARARAGDLRARIGRVNGLFNFVHGPDEPVDVLRELQLFSYHAGWSWCADALADPAGVDTTAAAVETRQLLDALHEGSPAHDLDARAGLDRLAAADHGLWTRLAVRHPRAVDRWLDALSAESLPDGSARWDVLSVVTAAIDCNEPGVRPLVHTATVDDWRTR
ncbi:hypothetical protein [Actinoplanes sp. NPDC051859]|uniref:hypothetical protein n=1 Tax=Actinoplanes sp. NPDC051859 TaxID=3363909 RepID=UPI0037B838EA